MAAVHDGPNAFGDLLHTQSPSSNVNYLLYLTVLLALLFPTYRYVNNDYHKFLDLGPGGTPSTFSGYLRVTYLRIFFALQDPFQPPSLAEAVFPADGYLNHLPQRSSPRPHIAGIAPHRQINQWAPETLRKCLEDALCSLVDRHPNWLRKGVSCFEKFGLALFLSASNAGYEFEHDHDHDHDHDDGQEPSAFNHLNPTCRNTGEVVHLHGTDSSLHMTLHPIDAALVIAAGWGERHPLAGRLVHGKRLLPSGFVMVYAPCKKEDIDTIIGIVRAGAWWVGGVDLEGVRTS